MCAYVNARVDPVGADSTQNVKYKLYHMSMPSFFSQRPKSNCFMNRKYFEHKSKFFFYNLFINLRCVGLF